MSRIIDTWTTERTAQVTVTKWHIGSGIETTQTITHDPAESALTPEDFLNQYCAANGITLDPEQAKP